MISIHESDTCPSPLLSDKVMELEERLKKMNNDKSLFLDVTRVLKFLRVEGTGCSGNWCTNQKFQVLLSLLGFDSR